jgi:hypothetical protein
MIALLGGAVTAATLAFVACANPDTQNPTCTYNVDEGGILPAADGCESFATCPLEGGAPACCTADDGGALGSNDYRACLHGYGDPDCAHLLSTPVEGGVLFTCSDGGGGG